MDRMNKKAARPRALGPEAQRELRDKILDAAAAAFTERGFEGASVDDVVASLNQTKGVVYYHFRSKLDLYFGIYERGMVDLSERVRVAETSAAEVAEIRTGADQLRTILVTHASNVMRRFTYHYVIQHGIERHDHLALTRDDRTRFEATKQMRSDYELLVQSVIEQGIADGSIRDVPVKLCTRTLLGGVVGIGNWYRPRVGESEADWMAIATQTVDLLLVGLMPATQRAEGRSGDCCRNRRQIVVT